jgi:hypothetical protein
MQNNIITPLQLKASNHTDDVVKQLRTEYQEYHTEVLTSEPLECHYPQATRHVFDITTKSHILGLHVMFKNIDDAWCIDSIQLDYDGNTINLLKKHAFQLLIKTSQAVQKRINNINYFLVPLPFCSDEFPLPNPTNNKVRMTIYKLKGPDNEPQFQCPELLLTSCTEKFISEYKRALYPFMIYQEQSHPILNRRAMTVQFPFTGVISGILIYVDGFPKIRDVIESVSFRHGNFTITEINFSTTSNYDFGKMSLQDGTIFFFAFTKNNNLLSLGDQFDYLKNEDASYINMHNVRDIELIFTFKPINPKTLCLVCPMLSYATVKNEYLFVEN